MLNLFMLNLGDGCDLLSHMLALLDWSGCDAAFRHLGLEAIGGVTVPHC